MATTNQDYINKMYDSSLESQKATLEQEHQQSNADLDAQKQAAQKQTDENLTRTYVEAAKAQKNYNEVQNAYGLSSGAMAQARLAQDNQLQANLTALRAQQQSVDADVERQKTLLSQQYAAAIRQAQANNDMARAQALYDEAKDAEDALLRQQKEAAALMAGAGDYSLYAQLYGLTPEQLARLQGETMGASGGNGGSYVGGGNGGGAGTGGSNPVGNSTGSNMPNITDWLGQVGDAIKNGPSGDSGGDAAENYTVTNSNSQAGVQVGGKTYTWQELQKAVDMGAVKETVNGSKVTYTPARSTLTGKKPGDDGGSVGDHYVKGWE